MNDDAPLRRTALFETHRALGARIAPFAGFEMPVQYAGIIAEHDAVRRDAGLFDLSHMAPIELRGDGVGAWADALTANHVATMKPLQARYNLFTNAAGGVHDDVIFYRLPERWLVVANASNAGKILALLQDARIAGIDVTSRHGDWSLIAIQGPRSAAMLAPFADGDIAGMRYYTALETTVAGAPAIVARTGYTGEDGFELFVDAERAVNVWDALLDAHRAAGLVPCGLGARDVLRLEAGMPLYGHEIDETITPLQAGLGWAVKFAKPAFPGKDALAAQAAAGAFPRIVGLVLDGRVPARAGYEVRAAGERAGEVRSGSIAPSAGGRSVATALVAAAHATEGARLAVEIRGTEHPATVVPLPFYKRG